jgi:hypothetical protein
VPRLGAPQGPLDEEDAWAVVHCLEDAHVLRSVACRLHCAGRFALLRGEYKVLLDGRLLGSGSARHGFDLRTQVAPGSHLITLKSKNIGRVHTLVRAVEGQNCNVELSAENCQHHFQPAQVS